jgi:hypothetical protein
MKQGIYEEIMNQKLKIELNGLDINTYDIEKELLKPLFQLLLVLRYYIS